MLSAEPSGDSASAVVRDTFASFRLAALDLERRAAALLSAVNGGPPPKRDASFLLRQTVALAEETVARARHVEGLNAVLRTSDVLDAAESARGRVGRYPP